MVCSLTRQLSHQDSKVTLLQDASTTGSNYHFYLATVLLQSVVPNYDTFSPYKMHIKLRAIVAINHLGLGKASVADLIGQENGEIRNT
jgi:hypothetical protein